MNTFEEELNDLMDEKMAEEEKDELDGMLSLVESWTTPNGKDFFFSFKNTKSVAPGLYSMIFTESHGYGISKMDHKSDEFFHLPSQPHQQIIDDLQVFWKNKKKFVDYKLNPKRGLILHGHPGCGKSSLLYLLVEEIKKINGICVMFDVPQNWVEVAKLIRKLEKDRPMLCIIEDLDLVLAKYGEATFLNFLDGLNSVDNVVYVATTNNLKDIPDRIKNRPSRFDKVYEIKKPTKEDRAVFFNSKIREEDKSLFNITKLVKDTDGFTMAHLKEVFISLYILGNDYKQTLNFLKKSNLHGSTIGYNASMNDDDEDDDDIRN